MATEAGIRALEAWYVREAALTPGVTPTNPDWLRFSDELDSVSFTPNGNNFERRAIGTVDPTGFSVGPEDHTIDLTYSMQRWLAGAGPLPLDASADGMLRDSAGGYLNTHSVLTRQDFAAPLGTDLGGYVVYTYGVGCIAARTKVSGDPESGDPSKVEISYVPSKARSYRIDQLVATGTLDVVSDSALDTTQSVTVESMDGTVSETIGTLTGVTPVLGIQSFDPNDGAAGNGIGFIRLDAECQGDVTISHAGATICVIQGAIANGGIEGDLGLPEIGTGSYEAALALPFQTILSSTLTRGGIAMADNVMGLSFEVNNSIDATPVVGTRSKVLNPGNRAITFNASVFGPSSSHDDITAHLQATQSDIVWTFTGGTTARTVTIPNAILQTPGNRAYSKGEATMKRDNTFVGTGITISTGL